MGEADRPPELDQPGILEGEGLLTKDLFVEIEGLGPVGAISAGELDPAPGPEIGIAGVRSVVFVDRNGVQKSSVKLRLSCRRPQFIDLEGDGICEVMNRGAWHSDPGVLNHDGRVRWAYGGDMGSNDMCAGDMDGDGRPEFAVGFNGSGGIHLLSTDGDPVWEEEGSNIWSVAMLDLDDDGKPEIVHSNFRGVLTVRDAEGTVKRTVRLPVYVGHFSLCPWPTQDDPPRLVTASDEQVWVVKPDGDAVIGLEAPYCGTTLAPSATLVTFRPGEPPYVAIAVYDPSWKRSILYIHAPGGGLVYQEVFDEQVSALAAVALNDDDTQTLLVGGEGRVWAYHIEG